MRKTFKKQLWMKALAVVLALALNLGALDGVIRLAVEEWALGSFGGFLRPAAAKKVDNTVYDTGPDKNGLGRDKNVLPETAGPKKPKNPAALEAKSRNEVREKRTEYSKTFKISDSEYRTEVYQEPVHYRDENNGLADIDNTLVESAEKGYALENRANSFKVRFSENSWVKSREKAGETAGETVRETSGTASREMFREKPGEQKLGQIQQKKHALAWRLLDSKACSARAVLNTIIYPDITDYTDLRYIIDGKTLKEEIILNDPEAPSEFKFTLDIRHLDYTMRDDGSIDFTDPGTGDIIWNMPKPYMYDARGERSQAVTAEISRKYGLFGGTVLTVKADPE